jgi:hypothetical protein
LSPAGSAHAGPSWNLNQGLYSSTAHPAFGGKNMCSF